MNKPLFAVGIGLVALAVSMLWGVAKAQEFDASVSFTARGQGYWIVTVDGQQVSQHTTEREAYESATNQWFITDGAEIQVIHNAVIDVDGVTTVTGLPEPEIVEVPVEIIVEVEKIVEVEVPVIQEVIREVIVEVPVSGDGEPIGIPGAQVWRAIPPHLMTRKFRVLNDDWAVASDSYWLFAYNVTVDDGSGWIVYRPHGVSPRDGSYTASETTELTDDQVIQLIAAINGD